MVLEIVETERNTTFLTFYGFWSLKTAHIYQLNMEKSAAQKD